MNQFKRAQIIMLPTKSKSNLILTSTPILSLIPYESIYDLSEIKSQHLYIISNDKISDDKIKEGDWCYDKTNNRIVNFVYLEKDTKNHCFVSSIIDNEKNIAKFGYSLDRTDLQKIIATRDTSLNSGMQNGKIYNSSFIGTKYEPNILPQPSQQFIEKYIESYNKGEIITDILVEYEYDYTYPERFTEEVRLKVNPKDNTITIKKLKDSWNREEVKAELFRLLKDVSNDESLLYHYEGDYQEFNKWISENL